MSNNIDDLLKLLETRGEEKGKNKTCHPVKEVVDFVEEMKIEAGTTAVPNYLIFYYYRNIWKPEAVRRKVKKITFFQSLNKLLPDYRHGNQRFYMVNDGIFDLKLKEAAETYDRQHWRKEKSKKKKLSVFENVGSESET